MGGRLFRLAYTLDGAAQRVGCFRPARPERGDCSPFLLLRVPRRIPPRATGRFAGPNKVHPTAQVPK
jgi:hypothetical protein